MPYWEFFTSIFSALCLPIYLSLRNGPIKTMVLAQRVIKPNELINAVSKLAMSVIFQKLYLKVIQNVSSLLLFSVLIVLLENITEITGYLV